MPYNRTLFTFLFLLFFIPAATAQQKYPATLLWRISGKNLSKPSYVYGSMHVQDRRLFYFGDSLYQALEKTEAFAMEINPDEMMDTLFKSMGKKDTSALLKRILDENDYKRIAKELEKKLKIPADKITTQRLAEEKKHWYHDTPKKDDMPTIMDLYLFSIARKQGKYTGGIEDVADQLAITDEIGTFKINDYIKSDTASRTAYLEDIKEIYLKRDLTSLNKLINGELQHQFKDILLLKRNRKMSIRIDSLANLHSSLFVIGAAHLPGDSGVISLLQQRGFTVTPVFSSAYIAPEAYKYTIKEMPWQNVQDEYKMCTVQMPGIPGALSIRETLPMKMYMDLTDLSVYGIAVSPLSDEETKSDSFFNGLTERYRKQGFDVKTVKDIEYKNCRGIEMYAIEKGGGHYRTRFLLNKNKLFLIIYGNKNKEQLYQAASEKFMNSLVFNEENIAGKNQWEHFTNERNAFTMLAPGKVTEGAEKTADGFAFDKYAAINYSDGNYYTVVIRDTKPGYFIEDDSLYFEEYRKNLNKSTGNNVKEFSIVKFNGYNACHFSAEQKVNDTWFVLQGYLIRRGNRTYTPMAVSSKEKADFPDITNFFRSFALIPYKKSEWAKQSIDNTSFSTMAPGSFIKVKKDTASVLYDATLQKYNVRDKNDASSYSLEIQALSPYYWSSNDSVFFRNRANSFKGNGDSLISYRFTSGPQKNAEVLIQISKSGTYKKLKFFLNGDTVYTVYAYQSREALEGEQAKSFFAGVEFGQQYATTIFTDKAALLLQALKSNDSVTVSKAKNVLAKITFAKSDLPLLYEALPFQYKKFRSDFRSINELLKKKIIEINDSSVVPFVAKQYNIKSDSAVNIQLMLLELLASHKTAASYNLLKDLLINKTPHTGLTYNFIAALTDSIPLAQQLFPEVTALYSDSLLGGAIARVAGKILNSNKAMAAVVLQNSDGLNLLAKKQYELLKNDKENFPEYNSDIIELLGQFNSPQSNALLNNFASLPVMWVKKNAVMALLINGQPVAQTEINKFAADKAWRIEFYDSLKAFHKENLFPKEFYTQQKFADSYLGTSLSDEDIDVKDIQFIKEKTAVINGKQQRFFLYKVIPDSDEDTKPYLAVCGAFSMDKSIVELSNEELDVYYNSDQLFDLNTIDEQFQKYIDKKMQEGKIK